MKKRRVCPYGRIPAFYFLCGTTVKEFFRMKDKLKLMGIIALLAVIGFSMAACGDDSGGGGSFDGTWENNYKMQIVISGNSGRLTSVGTERLAVDASTRGYIKAGETIMWQNIRKVNDLRYDGEVLKLVYYPTNRNLCTGVEWDRNCQFTLSEDGKTLTVRVPSYVPINTTFTKQ